MTLRGLMQRIAHSVRAAFGRASRPPVSTPKSSPQIGPLSRVYLEATRRRLTDADVRSIELVGEVELRLRHMVDELRSLPTSTKGARQRAIRDLATNFDRMLSPESGEVVLVLRAHPARANTDWAEQIVSRLSARADLLLSDAHTLVEVDHTARQLASQVEQLLQGYEGCLPSSCHELEVAAMPAQLQGLTTRSAAERFRLHLQTVTDLLADRQKTLHDEVQRLTRSLGDLEPATRRRPVEDLEEAFDSLSLKIREATQRRVGLAAQSAAVAADVHVARLYLGNAAPLFRREKKKALYNHDGMDVEPSLEDRELLERALELARYTLYDQRGTPAAKGGTT